MVTDGYGSGVPFERVVDIFGRSGSQLSQLFIGNRAAARFASRPQDENTIHRSAVRTPNPPVIG